MAVKTSLEAIPTKDLPNLASTTLAGLEVPAVIQTARLCAHLGVNASTLWRWIRERNFPSPVHVGPKVRMWKTVEVEAWLNSQQKSSRVIG